MISDFQDRKVIYHDIDYPEAVTREQARKADERAIEFGIPGILLMENAAVAFVKEVRDYEVFAIVCGTGNNGGDGLAIARHLCILGKDVRVYILGDPNKGKREDFKTNLNIMNHLAPEVLNTVTEENFDDFQHALRGCEVCIDAVFGTGLSREVDGIHRKAIEAMNKNATCIISVDIPSGLDCNTGKELGISVRAGKTITFHRMKQGLDLAPEFGGDVTVVYVGIPN